MCKNHKENDKCVAFDNDATQWLIVSMSGNRAEIQLHFITLIVNWLSHRERERKLRVAVACSHTHHTKRLAQIHFNFNVSFDVVYETVKCCAGGKIIVGIFQCNQIMHLVNVSFISTSLPSERISAWNKFLFFHFPLITRFLGKLITRKQQHAHFTPLMPMMNVAWNEHKQLSAHNAPAPIKCCAHVRHY